MRAINIVDIGILAVIGLCVLYGLYQGFLGSMLRTGAALLSLGCGFWLYPRLAGLIQSSPTLQRTLLTYTDATSRLGDLSLSLTSVHGLTEEQIGQIVTKADLPASLSEILRYNLQNHIYTGISTVAEYVSETILSAAIDDNSSGYVSLSIPDFIVSVSGTAVLGYLFTTNGGAAVDVNSGSSNAYATYLTIELL